MNASLINENELIQLEQTLKDFRNHVDILHDRIKHIESMIQLATSVKQMENGEMKHTDAQILGQRGGVARARKLSASRRKEIAKKAAAARWKK